MSSGAPHTRAYGRPYGGILMEPPGGTHTTTDLYSKLSADPTIFAKLRIKSEKADALAIGFDLAQWLRRQLFRTLSSALRVRVATLARHPALGTKHRKKRKGEERHALLLQRALFGRLACKPHRSLCVATEASSLHLDSGLGLAS